MQQHSDSDETLPVAYIVSEELVKVGTAWGTQNNHLNGIIFCVAQPTFVTDLENIIVQVSSLLPSNKNRSLLVHSLVSAFGLQSLASPDGQKCIKFIRPRRATSKMLLAYHTRNYLDYALNPSNDYEDSTQVAEFGLEDVRALLYVCRRDIIYAT